MLFFLVADRKIHLWFWDKFNSSINWWFGARWFGIRFQVCPLRIGITRPQTTNLSLRLGGSPPFRYLPRRVGAAWQRRHPFLWWGRVAGSRNDLRFHLSSDHFTRLVGLFSDYTKQLYRDSNHYKDPYKPSSFWWNVTMVLIAAQIGKSWEARTMGVAQTMVHSG